MTFSEWVEDFKKKNKRLPKGYIGGPMTLYKDLEKGNPMRWGRYAFEKVAFALRVAHPGIELFVPIEQDDLEGGPDVVFTKHTWEEVLAKDLVVLKTCDFIMLLPDWTESDGATLEANENQRRGKPMFRAILFREGLDNPSWGDPLCPWFSDVINPFVITHKMKEPQFVGSSPEGARWTCMPRHAGDIARGTYAEPAKPATPTPGGFKPTNPKDRAATSRLDLTLFPQTAICYGALAMAEVDMKYGGYNYRPGGVLASVYVAALLRHIFKWYNGQEDDQKTQVPHLANAMACLGVLIDAVECGSLKDDRPPSVDVDDLLARFEAKVKHLQGIMPCDKPRYTQREHPMGKK